jgi:hypothetical protein
MSTISNFRYVEPLHLRRDVRGAGELFWVDKHYTVEFDKDGETVSFTVPRDTATDFASIPRVAQSIVQVLGRHVESAVVHDWLCVSKLWTSAIAADIFEEGMRAAGVNPVKRKIMASAVRLLGPRWV